MIPFLPEMPLGMAGAPGLSMTGGAVLPISAPEGAGLDFAGLLDAALPPVPPRIAPPVAESAVAALASEPDPAPVAPALHAAPLATLPTGKNMPEPGASLPQVLPHPVPPPTRQHTVPARLLVPSDDRAAASAIPESAAAEAVLTGQMAPPMAQPIGAPDSAAANTLGGEADDPAPQPEPMSVAEPEAAAALPDTSVANGVLAAALVPAPVVPLAPAPTPAPSSPARLQRGLIAPPAGRDKAPMPERVTLPIAPAEEADVPQQAASPALIAQQAPIAQPFPAPDAPAQALAAPPSAPAATAPDRVEAPRPPAPQQESAIAQVGSLREAMRSAQPEMTLRHADFGFVSLRLEAAGPQDWRAVLASRDPGFVPAIQAALAERAVAAATSASADSGQFMGQNGASDQRYGASPNGGQGGFSPYLGQSGGRDGEAAPDHRRPSTAAAMAARGQEQEEASGSDTRGLFA